MEVDAGGAATGLCLLLSSLRSLVEPLWQQVANDDDDAHVPSYAYASRRPRRAVARLLVRATPLVGATLLVMVMHTVPGWEAAIRLLPGRLHKHRSYRQ